MSYSQLRTALAVVALSLLVSLGQLAAQDGAAEVAASPDANSTTVTATRQPESTQAVPAMAQIVSAEQIADAGLTSVPDVLSKLLGIYMTSYSSPDQAQPALRGFGENSFGRVVVLVDGVRLNQPDMAGIDWSVVPVASIAKIEYIHGARAAMYGNGAIAGVINIITKHSVKPLSGSMTSGADLQGSLNLAGDVALREKDFGLRVFGETTDNKGSRDRTDSASSRAGLSGEVELADTLTLSSAVSVSSSAYQMPGGISQAVYDDHSNRALNYDDSVTSRGIRANLGLEWLPVEGLTLSLPLAWQSQAAQVDNPSYYNLAWGTPAQYTDSSHSSIEARPSGVYKITLDSHLLIVSGGLDSRYAWLDSTTWSDANRTTKYQDYAANQFTLGPWAAASIAIVDSLTLDVSGRFDLDHSSNKTVNHDCSAWVYAASLDYAPIKELNTYISYGTTFRYPFTDEEYAVNGAKVWDLKPETGTTLECGASLAVEKIMGLKASGYLLDLKNEIAYDGSYNNVNMNKTRRLGLDSTLTLTPVDFLTWSANYDFVKASFVAGPYKDSDVPLAPQHKLSSALMFILPFGLDFGPNVSWTSAAWQGGDYTNSQDKVKSYFLLGFAATLHVKLSQGQLDLSLSGTNLLDLAYASLVYYGAYYTAPGRNLRCSVAYRF